jgi:TP901 family phage tail tape measure protein
MASGVAADLLVHVGANVKDAISGLNSVDSKVKSSGAGFGKAGLAMGGASLAIVGGLGMAVNAAADYEASISQITALGGEYKASQEAISQLALDIGQKTAFSATEGALAIAELAKAGVPVKDILAGAAMEAANLAAAGGQSVPEAAVTMSNAMNMFGIAGENAASIADSFAAAANASASDVSDLAQALNQGGPASAALGNSLQETNAVLALFSNYGIKGSDAGTSLKTMLQSLTNPSTEAAQRMKELGIAAFDANGNFVGFEALAGQLKSSLAGLTQEQRAAALATIFGSDASRVANILYEEGAEGVAKMTDEVSKSGVAGEMAEAKMDNLNGALEQLKGSFETMLIVIGSAFIPIMRKAADGINGALNWFLKLPKPVQKLAGILGAGAAAFLALGAGVGVVIGFMPVILAGLGAIVAPIVLITALIAGLGYLWLTNFGDIQGIVERTRRSISDFFGPLRTWANLFETAFDASAPVANLIGVLPPNVRELAKGFLLVADALGDLYRAYTKGGFDKLFDELPDKLSQIGDGLKIMGSEILKGLISAVSGINWGAVWDVVASGLRAAWDAFVAAGLSFGNWAIDVAIPAIGGAIKDAFTSAKDWLISKLPWLGDFAGDVAAGALDLGLDLASWSINVGIPAVAGAALDAFTSAGAWLIDQLPWLAGLASDAAGALPDLGLGLANWAIDVAIPAIGGAIKGAFTSFRDWLVSKVPWLSAILGGGSSGGGGERNSSAYFGGGDSGFSFGPWNIDVPIPGVVGDILGAFSSAWEWVKDKVSWLKDALIDCGFPSFDIDIPSPSIGGTLGAIKDAYTSICDFLSSAIPWLADLGGDIAGAIGSFILDIPLPTIAGTLADHAGTMWDFLKSGISWLSDSITQAITVNFEAAAGTISAAADFAMTVMNGIATAAGWAWDGAKFLYGKTVGLVVDVKGDSTSTGLPAEVVTPSVTDIAAGSETLKTAMADLVTARDNMTTYLTEITGGLTTATTAFQTFATDLGTAGTDAGTNFSTNLDTELSPAETAATDAQTAIKETLTTLAVQMSGLGTAGGNGYAKNLGIELTKASTAMEATETLLTNSAEDAASMFGTQGTKGGSNFATNLGTKLQTAVTSTDGIMTGLINQTGRIVGPFGTNGYNAGAALARGVGDGIRNWIGSATSAAQQLVDAVEGILSNVPGYSPIDHMGAFFGSKLGYGFTSGLASAIPTAGDVARELLGAAADNLSGGATFDAPRPLGRAGAAIASGANSGTIVQNIEVNVKLDELEDMVEAGRFVSQLNGTRTLYKGAAFAGGNI